MSAQGRHQASPDDPCTPAIPTFPPFDLRSPPAQGGRRCNGRWRFAPAGLFEDPLAGEQRGAVRAFRHRKKLCAFVVEQDPAAVARDDRTDPAEARYLVAWLCGADRAIDP